MKKLFHTRSRIVFLIVFLTGMLTVFVVSSQQSQDIRQRAQGQANAVPNTNPTFGALGPCLNCVNPTTPPLPGGTGAKPNQPIRNLDISSTPCPVNHAVSDNAATKSQPAESMKVTQPQQSAYLPKTEQPQYVDQPVQPTYATQPKQPAYGGQTQEPTYSVQPTYGNTPYQPAYPTKPGNRYGEPTKQPAYGEQPYNQPTYGMQPDQPYANQPTYAMEKPGYGNQPQQPEYKQPQKPRYGEEPNPPAYGNQPSYGEKPSIDGPPEYSKHKHHKGGISRLVKLFIDLLMLLLKLLGIGQMTPVGVPSPVSPTPALDPCNPAGGIVPSAGVSTPGLITPGTMTPPVPSGATPKVSVVPTPLGGNVIKVKDSAELKAALTAVKPGQTIEMADGQYQGPFVAAVPGDAAAPIKLRGSQKAIISSGAFTAGTGLELKGANFWQLEGFSITNSEKGLVLGSTNHTKVSNLQINTIGDEAMRLLGNSSDNILSNNNIKRTGLKTPAAGVGIYVGSGASDKSDRNELSSNIITETTGECIALSEGTTGGNIKNNNMNGGSMSGAGGADSWLLAKGNSYIIEGNFGSKAFVDGFQTQAAVAGWGNNNVFIRNNGSLGGTGIGINIDPKTTGNMVKCSNSFTSAPKGVSNIKCVP